MKKYSRSVFGKKLQKLRRERMVGQLELSEAIDASVNAVSKWENGRVFPELEYFCRICNEFDVTPNDLLEVDDE